MMSGTQGEGPSTKGGFVLFGGIGNLMESGHLFEVEYARPFTYIS